MVEIDDNEKYINLTGLKEPQQRKKEDRERIRGEGDQITFIDVRFERCL